jgi:hypothetical protein
MKGRSLCESSNPSGSIVSPERKRLPIWPCLELLHGPKKGQIDADLGGDVVKQRVARPGQGKSKGYRTIILLRRGSRAFFVYGFSKSQRANINEDEEEQFKEAAKHVLALTERQLAVLLKRGDFVEMKSE